MARFMTMDASVRSFDPWLSLISPKEFPRLGRLGLGFRLELAS